MFKIFDKAKSYLTQVKENHSSSKEYQAYKRKQKRLAETWVIPLGSIPVMDTNMFRYDMAPPIYAFQTPQGKLVYSKKYDFLFKMTHLFAKTEYEQELWLDHTYRRRGTKGIIND